MSKLISLQTDLKSLKYSKDRPDLGYSGQPFMQKDINDAKPTKSSDEDFLLRGGLNAPATAGKDVARLFKYFKDVKSPSGLLFVAKQNLLSKTSVKTQSSDGSGYGGGGISETIGVKQNGPINQGVYTPLSTLIQAGVGFLGAHGNFLGLDPTSPMTLNGKELYNTGFGLNLYEKSVKDNDENRLVNLTDSLSKSTNIKYGDFTLNPNKGGSELMSYGGGPGSVLGFGLKTIIKNNSHPIGTTYNEQSNQLNLTPPRYQNELSKLNTFSGNTYSWTYTQLSSLGDSTSNQPEGYDQDKFIFNTYKSTISPTTRDFRKPLLPTGDNPFSTITGIAPNYNPADNRTIGGIGTSRINYSSPGTKGNIYSYSKGKVLSNGDINITDRINFLPIYKSSGVKDSSQDGINDLVKFRIATLLRNGEKVYAHFRAYINEFSDSYGSKWNGISYMGRGEEFYKYGGFSRAVSVSFTVAAQSRPELMAQYKKLNFIASTLAPDYGNSGFMGGALHQLTLGGWCYELPGFIDKFNLTVPQESPWEIAIDDTVSKGKGTGHENVKEMPHMVNVQMSFTPIHKFRPELQDNTYEKDGTNFVSKYGPQRFISLANGEGESKTSYTRTPLLNTITQESEDDNNETT